MIKNSLFFIALYLCLPQMIISGEGPELQESDVTTNMPRTKTGVRRKVVIPAFLHEQEDQEMQTIKKATPIVKPLTSESLRQLDVQYKKPVALNADQQSFTTATQDDSQIDDPKFEDAVSQVASVDGGGVASQLDLDELDDDQASLLSFDDESEQPKKQSESTTLKQKGATFVSALWTFAKTLIDPNAMKNLNKAGESQDLAAPDAQDGEITPQEAKQIDTVSRESQEPEPTSEFVPLPEPVELEAASLEAIQSLHDTLDSLSFALKFALRRVFPLDKFTKLLKEVTISGMVPVDIAKRVQDVAREIKLPEQIRKAASVAMLAKILENKSEIMDFAVKTFPKLTPLENVVPDLTRVQEILKIHAASPEQALKELQAEGLKTFQALRIDKVLDVAVSKIEAKENAVAISKKIGRITNRTFQILFALAMCSLCLLILDDIIQNPLAHRIMEYMMVFDIAALMGAGVYAGMRINRLGAKQQQYEQAAQSVQLEPETTEQSPFVHDDSPFVEL